MSGMNTGGANTGDVALLVADIGGTNARFGIWSANALHAEQVLNAATSRIRPPRPPTTWRRSVADCRGRGLPLSRSPARCSMTASP